MEKIFELLKINAAKPQKMKYNDIASKIKNSAEIHKKEIVFALIIFLTASISFGIGYLASRELNHHPIIIEKCPSAAPKTNSQN